MAMPLAAVVLALDGESVNAHNPALDVLSIVSIVFGYVLIFCLWYFVFRGKARAKRRKGDPR
jgi:hypothetical protein